MMTMALKESAHPFRTDFNIRKCFIGNWDAYARDQIYPMLQEEGIEVKRLLTENDTPSGRAGVYSQTVPVTLLPSMVSFDVFRMGLKLQPILNQLMSDISRDPQFLLAALNDNVLAGDDFTSRMVQLYKCTQEKGIAENHALGIFRGDYMANNQNRLKLVEINTISVGFAGLAQAVRQFHRRIAVKLNLVAGPLQLNQVLPENRSLIEVARGLVKAQELYGNGPNNSIILIVTEVFLANHNDVRLIEKEIDRQSGHTIFHMRGTFQELIPAIRIGANQELLFRAAGTAETMEVGVVYYRTGYAPEDYAERSWWELRATIEHSRAIKCPNIGLHLAGSKHVQNVLSQQPAILNRWLTSLEADLLEPTFVKSYDVSPQSLSMAMQAAHNFVLKPNREGGANNVFGASIPIKMRELMQTQQAGSYGLMDFIHQTPLRGLVIQPMLFELQKTVNTFGPSLEQQIADPLMLTSELGFYGIHLCASRSSGRDRVVANLTAGHLLRTKLANSTEIGVIKGSGALDSPILV